MPLRQSPACVLEKRRDCRWGVVPGRTASVAADWRAGRADWWGAHTDWRGGHTDWRGRACLGRGLDAWGWDLARQLLCGDRRLAEFRGDRQLLAVTVQLLAVTVGA